MARLPAALIAIAALQAPALVGTLTDPVGDARPSAQLARPPDLVAARLEVSGGDLTITVSFAPETLTADTGLMVYLDTDENVETGDRIYRQDRVPIGADYAITGFTPHNPTRGALRHFVSPGQSVSGGGIPVATQKPDERRMVVALARLGNDDGRMRFKIECNHVLPATVTKSAAGETVNQTILQYLDLMPNQGAPAGVVR